MGGLSSEGGQRLLAGIVESLVSNIKPLLMSILINNTTQIFIPVLLYL